MSDLIFVNVLQELYGLLHSEERIAFLGHVESVVIRELLYKVHLCLQVLDPCLHHDVHEDRKVLVSCEVQLVSLDLHTIPELLDILIDGFADVGDQVQFVGWRECA